MVLMRSQPKSSTMRSKAEKMSFSSPISAAGSRETAISVKSLKSSSRTVAESKRCGVVAPKSFISS